MRAAAQALFRRRRLILGVFLLVQSAGGMLAVLAEPRWRAEAVLPAGGEVQAALSQRPGLDVQPQGHVLRVGLDGTDAAKVSAALSQALESVRPQAATDELHSQLAAARSEADAAAEKAALLKARLAALPATIALQSQSGRSRAAEEARAKLFELQAREQELLGKYQPDSTFVSRVRDERAKIQALADQMSAPETQIVQGTNPVHQEVEKDLIRTEATLSGAKSRIRSLTRQLEEPARPAAVPAIAIHAVGPSQTAIALSATVLGLISGIGLAALAHLLSSRLSTPADVERRLGLPVLTTIPRES